MPLNLHLVSPMFLSAVYRSLSLLVLLSLFSKMAISIISMAIITSIVVVVVLERSGVEWSGVQKGAVQWSGVELRSLRNNNWYSLALG